MGLNLAERAALLEMSCREYLQIAQSDPRIVGDAALATPHAVRRLQAWIAAGKPDADPAALAFCGCDAVRAIVVATIAGLPTPVRWHAVRFVSWFEIGRGSAGAYMTTFDPRRALDGDVPHVIVLDGRVSDEVLPGIVAHELGHAVNRSWSAPEADTDIEAPTWTRLEYDARVLAAFEQDRDGAARLLLRGEHLANDAALLWGYPSTGFCPASRHLQHFHERMDAAAELAVGIGHQVDEQLEAQGAAMIANEPTTTTTTTHTVDNHAGA